MGLKHSPDNASRGMSIATEVIVGDNLQKGNALGFHRVVLNMPGMDDYNPMRSWICPWNDELDAEAGSKPTYVDDIHPTGKDEHHCNDVAHQTASRANYLGIQDAPRKRRQASQTPGLWSGCLIMTDNKNIYVSTSQEKWTKGKEILQGWWKILENHRMKKLAGQPFFDFEEMRSSRGFLIHLGRTYPWIMPRLKGVHLTLDGWRGNRDNSGWKLSEIEREDILDNLMLNSHKEDKYYYLHASGIEAPKLVRAVPRLQQDIKALVRLFKYDSPPLRFVRGTKIALVRYGFGDASKPGFGASWQSKTGISYRYGIWGSDNESATSNYRELANLVAALREWVTQEDCRGMELFLFTDNSVAEACVYKGTSSNKHLFELVLELKELELENQFKVHVIHVAGTRMIAQGTDGLSRGNLLEGVMQTCNMMSWIPLHLSATQTQSNLFDWIKTWVKSFNPPQLLSPYDWFIRGHDIVGYEPNCDNLAVPMIQSGTYVWYPPPAVADAAVEQLRIACSKRKESLHVFVCPKLMKSYWLAQLHKVADIVFEFKAGLPFWEKDRYEPLILAICFPFLKHRPWQLRRSPALVEVGRILHGMWKEGEDTQGDFLCQLLAYSRKLSTLQSGMVWKVLQSCPRFALPYRSTRK